MSSPANHATSVSNKPIPWSALYELTKPRLSLLSVITALVGYLAALPIRDVPLFLHFICGTALCAGGAATLNQWLEKTEDGIMERTCQRPLPTGQVSMPLALGMGLAISIIGSAQLWLAVNELTGLLGAVTIATYVAIYTPLKKRTRWATEFGAIPGALPPLMGWTAAENSISTLGWILFGILIFWQMPHFMAIAWSFRADYAKAGFPMLAVIDQKGDRVARWALLNGIALFVVSLLPVMLGYTGWIHAAAAVFFGLWMLKHCIAFMKSSDRDDAAKKLFFNSIIYLPAVLFSLVIDRWIGI